MTNNIYNTSSDFANKMDAEDALSKFANDFHIPSHGNKEKAIYLTGNSLGAQPKSASKAIQVELEDWAKLGVEGHFDGRNPWFHYHKFVQDDLAKIVGAKPKEVVAMNSLTTNLHLMLVSFYNPTKERFKIITEGGSFPSDIYALETQVKFHGFDFEDAVIEIFPREGEHTLRQEDILSTIEKHKDSVALVMMSGVNYYTGQFFNIPEITKAAHNVGAKAGFDLAHAVGNLPLYLNEWNVDFAVWCSYKYLNSSAGGVGGAFVHEKHFANKNLPRFGGWWGHEEETRFQMKKGFIPMQETAAWQLSNAPVMSLAIHKSSLEIFTQSGGMEVLRKKSLLLTGYFEFLLQDLKANNAECDFEIITPSNPEERGCQLSILSNNRGKELFDYLSKNGIVADWRNPNVMRMAPTPLYNSFTEIYEVYHTIKTFYKS